MSLKDHKDKWFAKYPIAHRGWHWQEGIDENSWEAIELALKKGYPIEFDVHLSRDGVPYIHHDESLLRMTGIDKKASQVTAQELTAIKTPHSQRGIPLFKDVLDLVRGEVPLVIEIKKTRADQALEEAVLETLKNYKGDFSIQSFHIGTLKYYRDQRVKFPLGLLSADFKEDDLNFFTKLMLKSLCLTPFLKPDYIGYHYLSLSKRAPQHMREKYQIPLLGWTVRDEHAKTICDNFADNIIFESIKADKGYDGRVQK